MTDYRIEAATKEEWAERALRAERKLADTAIDYKKRCEELEANLADGSFYQEKDIDAWQNRIEELEAKLAQQDDLMQAAVAAALRKAANRAGEAWTWTYADVSAVPCQEYILALITSDAQAALDRVVAAERERCAKVAESRWRSWGQNDPHGAVECDVTACENIAAAIRKGDTP